MSSVSTKQASIADRCLTPYRAFRSAWSAGGWAMTAISLGSGLIAWRLRTWLVFAAFPTIILSIYGAAWMISATVSDRWWVRWVAAGCFIAAIGMALMPSYQAESLAFAAALLLLMAAPAPARATDLSGLPDAYVDVGVLDILRDENIDFARRLMAAGVSTELQVLPGLPHGFEMVAPEAEATQRVMANRLRRLTKL